MLFVNEFKETKSSVSLSLFFLSFQTPQKTCQPLEKKKYPGQKKGKNKPFKKKREREKKQTMACTRFYYDDCRTKKQLQQATDPGRWILNVPGNGANPAYMMDPQIIPQKWAGNLRTNTVNLESELRGYLKPVSRDCLGQDNYLSYRVPNQAIAYPECSTLTTDQSRATHPAWWYRDLEQVDWYTLPLDPQENTCLPFQNNLNTRILEKDRFTPKRDTVIQEVRDYLPCTYSLVRGGL